LSNGLTELHRKIYLPIELYKHSTNSLLLLRKAIMSSFAAPFTTHKRNFFSRWWPEISDL